MKTRSKTLPQINWDYCIFCRQKAIKKDRKLKRIESSERVKYFLNAARGKFDYDLLSLLTVDDVQKKSAVSFGMHYKLFAEVEKRT